MAQKAKAQDGSRFIKLVIPEHVEKVNQWCEFTQTKSAPKAIAKAIDMAMESVELREKVKALEYLVFKDKRTSPFFSGIIGEGGNEDTK